MSPVSSTRPVLPWGLAVVSGNSMLPSVQPGERLVVRYGATVRVGDVVLARFVDGTVALKRAAERRRGGWWLLSDNAADGVDSRHRGVVPDHDVLAVARWRCWPRPGPIPAAPQQRTE